MRLGASLNFKTLQVFNEEIREQKECNFLQFKKKCNLIRDHSDMYLDVFALIKNSSVDVSTGIFAAIVKE